MKKRIFSALKLLIIIYCLGGIILYYLQDKLFFHPQPLPPGYTFTFKAPFKEVTIPYSASSKISIVQFLTPDTPARGVVLYFHGNRENINHYASYANLFTRNQYEVWMIDYPGYGKSTGTFSEKEVYSWSLQLYKLARARWKPGEIVVYGKSLGTGIAAQLASVRDCRLLALETPYFDFPSIAGTYVSFYPVHSLISYQFPTWKYLQQTTAPVIIFQGTADRIITPGHASRLKPFLKKGDECILIEDGEHNNLADFPLFNQRLDSILQR